MITKADKSQIKQLIQSPAWRVVEQIAQDFITRTRDAGVVRDTEWDTLKSALSQEGQVQGINGLIQELYKHAQDA